MRSTLEERLHFLNSAYFGIDDGDDCIYSVVIENNELNDYLIAHAAKKAYGDLQRKIPYVINSNEMNRTENAHLKQMKIEFKNEVIDYLSASIPHLNDVSDLIESVSDIGNQYPDLFKQNCRFTIGLAQKWVNMTLKYLWIIGAIDGERLHAPIDRYILKASISNDNEYCLGIEYDYQNNNLNNWPSWDDINEYNNLQDRIRTEVENRYFGLPIKWENKAWIAMATQ